LPGMARNALTRCGFTLQLHCNRTIYMWSMNSYEWQQMNWT
jgi:hypothetical protein